MRMRARNNRRLIRLELSGPPPSLNPWISTVLPLSRLSPPVETSFPTGSSRSALPHTSICRPFVGQMVKGKKLDKFGDAYTTQCLPGDGWRTRHDAAQVGPLRHLPPRAMVSGRRTDRPLRQLFAPLCCCRGTRGGAPEPSTHLA